MDLVQEAVKRSEGEGPKERARVWGPQVLAGLQQEYARTNHSKQPLHIALPFIVMNLA